MHRSRYHTLLVAAVAALALSSVALASGGLSGTYKTTIKSPADLKGTWALALATGGTYKVTMGRHPVARGTYSSTSKTITFLHERGSGCNGVGTYAWKRSGKTLTFVRKREAPSCQGRAAVLSHPFTQAG
jgi:hypothetical protein